MPSTAQDKKSALLLNFKKDTITTVSRESFRKVASVLGFSETQAMHFAMARLRDQVLREEEAEEYPPLTAEQMAEIRKRQPKKKGKVLSSLL